MDGFTFHIAYYEALKELPKDSQKNVIEAILQYVFEDTETELKGIEKSVFSLIKLQLDTAKKQRENGKKGGAPKGNKNAQKNNPKTRVVDLEKQPKNKGGCISVVLEKEKPLSPLINEKERIKEKENIYPPYIPKEKESVSASAHALGDGKNGRTDELNEKQKEFFETYPNVVIDNYSTSDYAEIDFAILLRCFEESSFLRQSNSFSWICSHYRQIAAGEYRDYAKRTRVPIDSGQGKKLGSEWDDLE